MLWKDSVCSKVQSNGFHSSFLSAGHTGLVLSKPWYPSLTEPCSPRNSLSCLLFSDLWVKQIASFLSLPRHQSPFAKSNPSNALSVYIFEIPPGDFIVCGQCMAEKGLCSLPEVWSVWTAYHYIIDILQKDTVKFSIWELDQISN